MSNCKSILILAETAWLAFSPHVCNTVINIATGKNAISRLVRGMSSALFNLGHLLTSDTNLHFMRRRSL